MLVIEPEDGNEDINECVQVGFFVGFRNHLSDHNQRMEFLGRVIVFPRRRSFLIELRKSRWLLHPEAQSWVLYFEARAFLQGPNRSLFWVSLEIMPERSLKERVWSPHIAENYFWHKAFRLIRKLCTWGAVHPTMSLRKMVNTEAVEV